MEENNTTGLIGEGVKKLPLGQLLKRIGPGLIATGIVIGPGAVTTAAMLGSNYGYSLIWRKDVNAGYKAPTLLRICMTISYVFVLVMTVFAFKGTIIPGIAKRFH